MTFGWELVVLHRTPSFMFGKFWVHAWRWCEGLHGEQSILSSLRVTLIWTCQEVLKWVCPSVSRNRCSSFKCKYENSMPSARTTHEHTNLRITIQGMDVLVQKFGPASHGIYSSLKLYKFQAYQYNPCLNKKGMLIMRVRCPQYIPSCRLGTLGENVWDGRHLEGRVRKRWQVTADAYVHRFAYSNCSGDGPVHHLVCIV